MRSLFFLLSLLAFLSCTFTSDKKIKHSFYYWKTSFPIDSNSVILNNKLNIDHFYIHYFDVEWNPYLYMPVPVAEITGYQNSVPFINKDFTPVIFITNKCFESMPDQWCDSLAYKIRNKIISLSWKMEENYKGTLLVGNSYDTALRNKVMNEIQIDCDWTATTREKYFRFLKTFKRLFPGKKISVTIRLYPYKYADKMGVPPVDKGMLMCYNLTDIKNERTANSVFDINDLKKYLRAKPYPLPLDVALPVFGWYAWFGGTKFKGIIYTDDKTGIKDNDPSFKKAGTNFTVLADTMIGDNFLRQGDLLRMEYPSPADLETAAKLLHDKFPGIERIALYYYDNTLINRYEKTIQNIYALY
ncbi:hypothetical protein BH11BAC4_BH11BAC4_18090 [soil metagenome]